MTTPNAKSGQPAPNQKAVQPEAPAQPQPFPMAVVPDLYPRPDGTFWLRFYSESDQPVRFEMEPLYYPEGLGVRLLNPAQGQPSDISFPVQLDSNARLSVKFTPTRDCHQVVFRIRVSGFPLKTVVFSLPFPEEG